MDLSSPVWEGKPKASRPFDKCCLARSTIGVMCDHSHAGRADHAVHRRESQLSVEDARDSDGLSVAAVYVTPALAADPLLNETAKLSTPPADPFRSLVNWQGSNVRDGRSSRGEIWRARAATNTKSDADSQLPPHVANPILKHCLGTIAL